MSAGHKAPRYVIISTHMILRYPPQHSVLENLQPTIHSSFNVSDQVLQPYKTVPLRPSIGPEVSRKLTLPGFAYSRLMKVSRLSVLPTGRLYPQEIFLVLICIRVWVDSKATVRPEELNQWEFSRTPSGIEPVTFRLVAQWATAYPYIKQQRKSYMFVS